MSRSPHGSLLSACLIATMFGIVFLGIAAGCLLDHVHKFPTRAGPEFLILGGSLCGVLNLAAAWLLYRRHSWAISVYAASWSLNIIAGIAMGLGAHTKPPWFVLSIAVGSMYLALSLIIQVRRELRGV
jgi:hypothetical protein